MSFTPSQAHPQAGNDELWLKKERPLWLDAFLCRTFFGVCSIHHEARRNDLNKYCINCDCSVCQHCISSGSHRQHKLLKLYRHVYKDVVPLTDMEKHIDCSKIQPYKCNKQLVIALNPLPHAGSLVVSDVASCDICKRRLNDPDTYRYCSIACKVRAFSRKLSDCDPPFLSPRPLAKNRPKQSSGKSAEPVRRRKGIPHRAPFF